MKRRFLPLVAFAAACFVGLAVGADDPKPDEEPPVRLKKKNKQPAVPDQPKDDKAKDDKIKEDVPKDEKKEDMLKDVEPGPGAIEDEKEVLERISRNMKAVEDRFINKDLGESTRQLKDDITKDLDALIKMAETPPPSGSGGSGSPSSGSSKRGSSGSQSQPDQQPMNQGDMEKGGMNPMNGSNEGSRQGEGTTGRGVTSDNNPPKPPSGDDEKGKWGRLPESLRAQMNAYASQEEYMQKHQELIKEYYRNLAKPSKK